MKTIVLINLRDEKEAAKYVAYNPTNNLKMYENYVSKGYTEIGFDEETGDILFAIDNGKFISANNKNITFKRIS